MNMNEVIDFLTNGDQSDFSDLSSEDEFDNIENELIEDLSSALKFIEDNNLSFSDSASDIAESDDDIPLASITKRTVQGESSTASSNQEYIKHKYRWRKMDTMRGDNTFKSNFSDPPADEMTPLQYFKLFVTEDIIQAVVDQTNLYTVQKTGKSTNTNIAEILSLIGMKIMMGIVDLPSYKLYWSSNLRYEPIASVLPRNRYQTLITNLHFANNLDIAADDKLAKIRPIIVMVQDIFVKIEPEEYHSVNEQIIPTKTKFSSIRQYNPKKPKKWEFKNLVRAGASGIMYNFYIYDGKSLNNSSEKSEHLSKSSQVVAKLCKDLPGGCKHKVFFDNWFTSLDLLHYLKAESLLGVGTIRANRLQGCPLEASKSLAKKGRGTMDYSCDANSGLIIVKWVDNSVVQLASNYVGVEPVGSIDRWCQSAKEHKKIPCPQVVLEYNKSMGGVDLADMLIALYRIPCKTKKWYQKFFLHLIDIAKVNAWLLYRRHSSQYGKPKNEIQNLLSFSLDVSNGLIHANKVTPSRGRPSKRSRLMPMKRQKTL